MGTTRYGVEPWGDGAATYVTAAITSYVLTLVVAMYQPERTPDAYSPVHTGARFSRKARGPS
jgi:hypothetical protein